MLGEFSNSPEFKKSLRLFVEAGRTAREGEGNCPGETACKKFQSAGNKETVCQHCKFNRYKPLTDDIEAKYVSWLSHLFWLRRIRDAGASIRMDDLSIAEWLGISICDEVLFDMEQTRTTGKDGKPKVDTSAAVKKQWSLFMKSQVFHSERMMPNKPGSRITKGRL